MNWSFAHRLDDRPGIDWRADNRPAEREQYFAYVHVAGSIRRDVQRREEASEIEV